MRSSASEAYDLNLIGRCSTRSLLQIENTRHNNVLIRSGEARLVGWSRNMLCSGFITLHHSVIRRQIGFAARTTRTLSSLHSIAKNHDKLSTRIDCIDWSLPGPMATTLLRTTLGSGPDCRVRCRHIYAHPLGDNIVQANFLAEMGVCDHRAHGGTCCMVCHGRTILE